MKQPRMHIFMTDWFCSMQGSLVISMITALGSDEGFAGLDKLFQWSWAFEYSVPSFWHYVWRRRKYDFAGGTVSLRTVFVVLKVTCHPHFALSVSCFRFDM